MTPMRATDLLARSTPPLLSLLAERLPDLGRDVIPRCVTLHAHNEPLPDAFARAPVNQGAHVRNQTHERPPFTSREVALDPVASPAGANRGLHERRRWRLPISSDPMKVRQAGTPRRDPRRAPIMASIIAVRHDDTSTRCDRFRSRERSTPGGLDPLRRIGAGRRPIEQGVAAAARGCRGIGLASAELARGDPRSARARTARARCRLP
jgi:hypothetical protein